MTDLTKQFFNMSFCQESFREDFQNISDNGSPKDWERVTEQLLDETIMAAEYIAKHGLGHDDATRQARIAMLGQLFISGVVAAVEATAGDLPEPDGQSRSQMAEENRRQDAAERVRDINQSRG